MTASVGVGDFAAAQGAVKQQRDDRPTSPEVAVHNVLYGLLTRPAGRLAFWTIVY